MCTTNAGLSITCPIVLTTQGFSHITSKLKEMYQMITLGGDAELELVDTLDPFREGIVFRYACAV